MSFWGTVVRPGKEEAYVPPPEEDWNLHLSQATLEPTVPEGKRVAVAIKTEPGKDPLMICTLTAGRTDTVLLDLFLSQYTEFVVMGDYPVHLTGYYTPAQGFDDEGEEEEDEEFEPGALGFPVGPGEEDEDEEGEEDEDEDDELEGLDEDEDEDEDEDAMDEDGEMFGYPAMLAAAARRKKPHVVIEDVTEEDGKDAKGAKANGKAKPAKEESEEEEEDEEDEEGESDDEGEEEEEEPAPAKGGKQTAAAGGKRAADGPAAKGAAAKAEQQPAKKQAVGQQQPQPAPAPAPAPKAKEAKPEAKPQKAAEQPKGKQQPEQQGKQQKAQEAKPQEAKGGKKNIRRHPNGFEVEDVSFGAPHAKLAKPGHKVLVRYTGRLKQNGKVFDKSGAKPFQFRLGVGEVIKGWDLGVEGMRVGDKRRLLIPPQLAYGSSGVRGTIPPNATLEFDVELVDVK